MYSQVTDSLKTLVFYGCIILKDGMCETPHGKKNSGDFCGVKETNQPAQIQISVTEPCHEKTNVLVSDLVRHKPGCTATEDG